MNAGDPITVLERDAIGPRGFRAVWVQSFDRHAVTASFHKGASFPLGHNFYELWDNEGATWCRGHEGPAVDALRVAVALGVEPVPF